MCRSLPVVLRRVCADCHTMITGRIRSKRSMLHGLRSRPDFLRHGRAFDRRDCRRSAGGDRSVRISPLSTGQCYKTKRPEEMSMTQSFFRIMSRCEARSRSMRRAFAMQYRNTDPFSGKRLAEPYGTAVCCAESACKATDPAGNGRRLCTSVLQDMASDRMMRQEAFRQSQR